MTTSSVKDSIGIWPKHPKMHKPAEPGSGIPSLSAKTAKTASDRAAILKMQASRNRMIRFEGEIVMLPDVAARFGLEVCVLAKSYRHAGLTNTTRILAFIERRKVKAAGGKRTP